MKRFFWTCVAAGVTHQIAAALTWYPAFSVALERGRHHRWGFALTGARGTGPLGLFTETGLHLRGSYSWLAEWRHLTWGVGLAAGPGMIWQTMESGPPGKTSVFSAGPLASVEYALRPGLGLLAQGQGFGALLKLDEQIQAAFFPLLLLGLNGQF